VSTLTLGAAEAWEPVQKGDGQGLNAGDTGNVHWVCSPAGRGVMFHELPRLRATNPFKIAGQFVCALALMD
jgi:hypothetical protein